MMHNILMHSATESKTAYRKGPGQHTQPADNHNDKHPQLNQRANTIRQPAQKQEQTPTAEHPQTRMHAQHPADAQKQANFRR
jgi:hypothetical protein